MLRVRKKHSKKSASLSFSVPFATPRPAVASSSSGSCRGTASDEECKRRRREQRKAHQKEKRERKKSSQPLDSSTPTNTRASGELDEQDDTPRTLGCSYVSPSPLSTDTDDSTSELSAHHSATSSTSDSWSLSDLQLESRVARRKCQLDFLSGVHVPDSISNIGEAKRNEVRRVHLLYNPWSGSKKGERKMRKARRMLERQGKQVTVTKLLHKGHAEELCETMDFTGIDVLCSVGGDGTFHECVNGITKRINKSRKTAEPSGSDDSGDEARDAAPADKIPPLAFIGAGTGNSFVHELGCVRTRDAVRHICRGIEVAIDLNKLTYGDEECYSFNSIHWGIGSRVVETAERFRWMGNSVRYVMAALVELVKGNDSRVRMVITDENDNEFIWDEECALGIANTIITAGKGMKMAPTAKIDDGLIDLFLFTSKAPKDLLAVLRRFYNGTHGDLPHVRFIKAKKFSVVPYKRADAEESGEESAKHHATGKHPDGELASDAESTNEGEEWLEEDYVVVKEMVDIDGELKGFTPFTCEVLPRALRVIL